MALVIIVLCLLGVLLLALEAILPGGVLGIAGFIALGTSAFFCFSTYGPAVGGVYLIVAVPGALLAWYLAFRFILPTMALAPPAEAGESAKPESNALVGREAEVIEDLDPSGLVRLDGRRRPAYSESSHEVIAAGEKVRVVALDSTYLVCRRLEGERGADGGEGQASGV